MQIIRTVQDMEHERTQWAGQVGFVPTMGYLHEGHLSLVRCGRAENEILVASIFVNPTQFGASEDLSRYPSNIERDLQLLEKLGVDVVFMPSAQEMYPQGFSTYVEPTGLLSEQAEGSFRPGHFRGVATIVLKLFNLVQPRQAYFGQKDAQQVVVIKQMVEDLNLRIQLRILSTIREEDGLALSSRNSYLDPVLRRASTILYQALQAGRATFEAEPETGPQAVREAMLAMLAHEPLAQLDYAEVRHGESFLPLERLQAPALLLIAAQVGTTRLIDNFALNNDGTWDVGIAISDLRTDPDKDGGLKYAR